MELNKADFKMLFGAKGDLPEEVCHLISKCNFCYGVLSEEESNDIILEVLKKIDSVDLPVSGKDRKDQWEKGWSENLNNFVSNKFDILELVPKYYRPTNVMRLWGQYIKAESNTFEYDFFSVFRLWVYLEYLSNASATFEFGCGSGCNLPVLAELFPEKELHGLDWVRSSVDIVNEMRSQYGWNMTGHLFDLFNPDYSLAIDDNSEFITFGALEQLGANYKEFVEFTINKKPVLCVHIEPLYELYNPNSLLDYFARKYHKKRGYLDNFLSYLEGEDRVKIIEWERMDFGGLFQDGWSRVVWQPIEEER